MKEGLNQIGTGLSSPPSEGDENDKTEENDEEETEEADLDD